MEGFNRSLQSVFIMAVSKGRYAYSFKEGKKAENLFSELMKDRGNKCVKSNKQDDIKSHIDFYVENEKGESITVDVKGNRYLKTIWLELKNVRGEKGWLECCADYIVFDIIELKSFCFFLREDLYIYANQFKDIAKDKYDYKKRYTRKDREDVLIKVTYDDIKNLQKAKIEYEQKSRQLNGNRILY